MEERVITEARRAVEAVVMAAIEPVEPQVLAQLVEIPVTEVEALCSELAEEYERDGRGFALGARRRRLPVPDPPGHGAVRRAVRARGPDGAAVGARARDAGDRRVQAARRGRSSRRSAA